MGLSGAISPDQQSQVLQGYPLCGLHVPSCCGWAANVAGVLVGEVGPLGPQGKAGAGRMVLARLMESDRNSAHQHQASYVERK